MAQFENFIPPTAFVIRNSREEKIDAKLIVPGDIVLVATGENIPCDIVIFKSNEMKVQNVKKSTASLSFAITASTTTTEQVMQSYVGPQIEPGVFIET